jgi:hypothetical protein
MKIVFCHHNYFTISLPFLKSLDIDLQQKTGGGDVSAHGRTGRIRQGLGQTSTDYEKRRESNGKSFKAGKGKDLTTSRIRTLI